MNVHELKEFIQGVLSLPCILMETISLQVTFLYIYYFSDKLDAKRYLFFFSLSLSRRN